MTTFNIQIQNPQTGEICPIQLEGFYAKSYHVEVQNKEDAIGIVAIKTRIPNVEDMVDEPPSFWGKKEIINWDNL